MIPDIREILRAVAAGDMSLAQAESYIEEHMKLARNEADASALRDHFAGLAMQGWISTYGDEASFPSDGMNDIAHNCFALAEAMMKAR